jgi:hypothetical protein
MAEITGIFDQGTWTSGIAMGFSTAASGDISSGGGKAERMRIHSDGKVSINSTTNSGYQLDVNGTVRAQSTMYLGATPATDDALTNVLVRDGTAGEIKTRSTSTFVTTTGDQSIAGIKTFTGSARFNVGSHVFASDLYLWGGDGTNNAIGVITNNVLSRLVHEFSADKTASFSLGTGDEQVIPVDATSGAITVTLPPANTSGRGRAFIIKKIDNSANAVTIDGDTSDTIDGAANYSLATQWKYVKVVSDGTNWLIIGNN